MEQDKRATRELDQRLAALQGQIDGLQRRIRQEPDFDRKTLLTQQHSQAMNAKWLLLFQEHAKTAAQAKLDVQARRPDRGMGW